MSPGSSAEPPAEPANGSPSPQTQPEPPPLPPALLEQWPVVAVGAVAWLVATVLAFAVPALESWRPVAIAGLAVGLAGTAIFWWQRRAAQRGDKGAQTGLSIRNNRDDV